MFLISERDMPARLPFTLRLRLIVSPSPSRLNLPALIPVSGYTVPRSAPRSPTRMKPGRSAMKSLPSA